MCGVGVHWNEINNRPNHTPPSIVHIQTVCHPHAHPTHRNTMPPKLVFGKSTKSSREAAAKAARAGVGAGAGGGGDQDDGPGTSSSSRRYRVQSSMHGTVPMKGVPGLFVRPLPALPKNVPRYADTRGAVRVAEFARPQGVRKSRDEEHTGGKGKEGKGKEGERRAKKPRTDREPTAPASLLRLDGTFSMPVSVLGEATAIRIETALSVTPKDMSSIYGGKPPPPYPTTVRTRDEHGEERLHVSRAVGPVLWGPPPPADVARLGHGTVPKANMAFRGTLLDAKPPQRQAVDRVKAFMAERGPRGDALGMLVAPTGTGKTVMGLCTAAELAPPEDPDARYLTAVVCHRDILLTQWKERIGEFMPAARVGLVQGNEFDVVGKDIVVFMIDSLLSRAESPEDERAGRATDPGAFMAAWEAHMANPRRRRKGVAEPKATLPPGFKKYPAFLLRRFGLVIYDEGHHLASKTYAKAFGLLPARCCLTLTATPKRGGKIIPQLFWVCGEVVAQFPRGWQAVNVRAIRYENPATQRVLYKGDLVAVWDMNKALAYDFERNDRIVAEVEAALRARRHVLVFTERVKHSVFLVRRLHSLRGRVGEDPKRGALVGWYSPLFSRERRMEELKARVIVTTYQYAREGLDVKTLDTVVLASPVSQLEQILGRIFRPCPDKQTPLVIDMYEDYYDLYGGMWGKRHAYYTAQEQGYAVDLLEHCVGSGEEEGKGSGLGGDGLGGDGLGGDGPTMAEQERLLEELPSDDEDGDVLWEDVVFPKGDPPSG